MDHALPVRGREPAVKEIRIAEDERFVMLQPRNRAAANIWTPRHLSTGEDRIAADHQGGYTIHRVGWHARRSHTTG
jgi:hypothetical protein